MSSDKRMKRFEGKVALITGAAGDLGSTTAQLFAEEGARLVLCDLPTAESNLKQQVTQLSSLGSPGVIYVCGDVTNVEDVKKSVQRGVDEFGGIDILMNSAGIGSSTPLQITDDALFKKIQEVNVYGTFLMMKYVSNEMIKAGKGGVIVNMSSTAGLMGVDIAFAYCASKFAVCGMTRAAAKGLAKNNIRVCAVSPHLLEGSMIDGVIENLAGLAMQAMGPGPHDKDTVLAATRAGIINMTALGRPAQMKEAAEVVLFLCSKEASYVTGVVLPVDGGATA